MRGHDVINFETTSDALDRLEIDKLGLDSTDKKMLLSLMDKFGGGPVGLDTLAATINEDSNTIEDVYEPYLLQLGFISRTPRGRVALKRAYDHLGKKMPKNNKYQLSMFDED